MDVQPSDIWASHWTFSKGLKAYKHSGRSQKLSCNVSIQFQILNSDEFPSHETTPMILPNNNSHCVLIRLKNSHLKEWCLLAFQEFLEIKSKHGIWDKAYLVTFTINTCFWIDGKHSGSISDKHLNENVSIRTGLCGILCVANFLSSSA